VIYGPPRGLLNLDSHACGRSLEDRDERLRGVRRSTRLAHGEGRDRQRIRRTATASDPAASRRPDPFGVAALDDAWPPPHRRRRGSARRASCSTATPPDVRAGAQPTVPHSPVSSSPQPDRTGTAGRDHWHVRSSTAPRHTLEPPSRPRLRGPLWPHASATVRGRAASARPKPRMVALCVCTQRARPRVVSALG
jgi:hypothetical protein